MPSVTVDVADLETLLFATSGIKDLEAALDQRRRNPMVISTKGKLEGAHDRLSLAWRRAKREADWPMKVVTEAEIAELRSMFTDLNGHTHAFAVLYEYPMHFAQDLLLVEAGPLWEGYQVEWPSPAEPEFVRGPTGGIRYGARLSHYGRQVLGVQEGDLMRPDHVVGHGAQAREGGLRPIGDIVGSIVQRAIQGTGANPAGRRFNDTVAERAAADPEFRKALANEGEEIEGQAGPDAPLFGESQTSLNQEKASKDY